MKPIIYHIGLTPPPSITFDGFEICYFPVLSVKYESFNTPGDLSDILKQVPIAIIMSKNAVIGLHKWLTSFNLESNLIAN